MSIQDPIPSVPNTIFGFPTGLVLVGLGIGIGIIKDKNINQWGNLLTYAGAGIFTLKEVIPAMHWGAPPITCPTGQHLANGACVPDTINCPTGQHLVNGACVPDVINCPTGYHLVNGVCTPDTITCPTGYHLVNNVCVPLVTCPTGQHLANGVCIPDTVGGGALDPFGVKMLYASKPGGQSWFMNTTNILNDNRVLPANISAANVHMNTDGSFKLTFPADSDNRLNIVTTAGYSHARCVLDWNVLIQRGYMQDTIDWRNVEITGYVRVNSIFLPSALVWYARGGHHSENYICEGSKYAGNIMYPAGTSRFQKEMGHGGGIVNTYFPTAQGANQLSTAGMLGKYFGFKFCLYDLPNGDVKLENWLDYNMDNNWVKIREQTDNGLWGTNPANCGGVADQKFKWGGPQAVFRFDSVQDIDFAKLSIREI